MTDHRMSEDTPPPAPTTRRVTIPPEVDPLSVLGASDQVLRAVERGFPKVRFLVMGREITLSGMEDEVDVAAQLLIELTQLARRGQPLDVPGVEHAVRMLTSSALAGRPADEVLQVRGRSIRPKSPGQSAYVDAIDRSTVVFGIGPAGTGKTYLAMAQAVQRLLSGQVRRIVLTRPAVEAGENLGFLPGSLTDKIDPYLRPLYDALGDMLDPEALPRLMAAGTIEVAPLAYMRGRTLNDSFIILDEAQNATVAQMKMFLTRLGFNSQVVVTGDISQIDLAGGAKSGLASIQQVLDGIDGIEFCHLTSADVVRHALVGHIIDAYDAWDARVEGLRRREGGRRTRGGRHLSGRTPRS
ncbi:PhoH family protein [Schaalia sp. 19OD2882]|uniref:PhoH family protein n=1 Tax=Schaalia sp. 19OD2882 TaxID=2794089 RepID=UPI001C1EE29D|nr:PhoH family protein [Schaalia sp. 19OD2882]QWW20714.1 PhoH family protein [Schaalia sp. 19OD2882]